MPAVGVINYGSGNILSVVRACEACGAEVIVVDDVDKIKNVERLILPGVGAFAEGMAGLRSRALVEPIIDFASTGRPMLGICLGMQMMFDYSEEFGNHKGLGLIRGVCKKIPYTGADGKPHKLPHIGWSELLPSTLGVDWAGTILDGIKPGSFSYFVHSFYALPECESNKLADTNYDGRIIAAVVKRGASYGCQFHPEKSGKTGLKIMRNFLNIGL